MNNITSIIVAAIAAAAAGSAAGIGTVKLFTPIPSVSAAQYQGSPAQCQKMEKLASSWVNPFAPIVAERIHERLGCDPRALADLITAK